MIAAAIQDLLHEATPSSRGQIVFTRASLKADGHSRGRRTRTSVTARQAASIAALTAATT